MVVIRPLQDSRNKPVIGVSCMNVNSAKTLINGTFVVVPGVGRQ